MSKKKTSLKDDILANSEGEEIIEAPAPQEADLTKPLKELGITLRKKGSGYVLSTISVEGDKVTYHTTHPADVLAIAIAKGKNALTSAIVDPSAPNKHYARPTASKKGK